MLLINKKRSHEMKNKRGFKIADEKPDTTGQQKPVYEPPKIITYTSEEILEEIGPAMACSPDPWCTIDP